MNEPRFMRWVEIISILAIVASITAMSLPKRGEMQRAGAAARLLGDVEVMRQAVFAFYSDSAYFPRQQAGQAAPDGLLPYLPRGFALTRPYGRMEYRNWPMAVRDTAAAASNVVAVTVTVADPRVGAAAEARAHAMAKFVIGNMYTFIFFGA